MSIAGTNFQPFELIELIEPFEPLKPLKPHKPLLHHHQLLRNYISCQIVGVFDDVKSIL